MRASFTSKFQDTLKLVAAHSNNITFLDTRSQVLFKVFYFIFILFACTNTFSVVFLRGQVLSHLVQGYAGSTLNRQSRNKTETVFQHFSNFFVAPLFCRLISQQFWVSSLVVKHQRVSVLFALSGAVSIQCGWRNKTYNIPRLWFCYRNRISKIRIFLLYR